MLSLSIFESIKLSEVFITLYVLTISTSMALPVCLGNNVRSERIAYRTLFVAIAFALVGYVLKAYGL